MADIGDFYGFFNGGVGLCGVINVQVGWYIIFIGFEVGYFFLGCQNSYEGCGRSCILNDFFLIFWDVYCLLQLFYYMFFQFCGSWGGFLNYILCVYGSGYYFGID